MSKKKVAVIDQAKCDRSPMCPVARVCPAKAVVRESKGISKLLGIGSLSIDEEKCTGCGACIRYCPRQAVRLV